RMLAQGERADHPLLAGTLVPARSTWKATTDLERKKKEKPIAGKPPRLAGPLRQLLHFHPPVIGALAYTCWPAALSAVTLMVATLNPRVDPGCGFDPRMMTARNLMAVGLSVLPEGVSIVPLHVR